MMPGLALTVANPLIVVAVPADWGPTGTTRGTIWAQVELRAPTAISTVSIHRGASPGRPEFGLPGPLNLSNSPMNPANHSMKEKVQ
jgi:hypothetical protein